MTGRDEDLPYRTAVPMTPGEGQVSSSDVDDYGTLKAVKKALDDALADLSNDFNIFTIDKDKTPKDRAAILLHEVEVKQAVYDIIAPLAESVNNAITLVDNQSRSN